MVNPVTEQLQLFFTLNCCTCKKPISIKTGRFIIFPCEHAFHFSCFFKVATTDNCLECYKIKPLQVLKVIPKSVLKTISASSSASSTGVLVSSASTQVLNAASVLKKPITDNEQAGTQEEKHSQLAIRY